MNEFESLVSKPFSDAEWDEDAALVAEIANGLSEDDWNSLTRNWQLLPKFSQVQLAAVLGEMLYSTRVINFILDLVMLANDECASMAVKSLYGHARHSAVILAPNVIHRVEEIVASKSGLMRIAYETFATTIRQCINPLATKEVRD